MVLGNFYVQHEVQSQIIKFHRCFFIYRKENTVPNKNYKHSHSTIILIKNNIYDFPYFQSSILITTFLCKKHYMNID